MSDNTPVEFAVSLSFAELTAVGIVLRLWEMKREGLELPPESQPAFGSEHRAALESAGVKLHEAWQRGLRWNGGEALVAELMAAVPRVVP